MNEIILFGEDKVTITSSCTACSGCSDKNDNKCTDDLNGITANQLAVDLENSVKILKLDKMISIEFRDINSTDLTEYEDVKTLKNMSFSFPILTLNRKIKYMGPFNPEKLLTELKESLEL